LKLKASSSYPECKPANGITVEPDDLNYTSFKSIEDAGCVPSARGR
jgi:hypothetical protein